MQLQPIIISTAEVVGQNRDEITREHYGKIAMPMEITPHSSDPASIEATSFVLPGVAAAPGVTNSITCRRTRAMDVFVAPRQRHRRIIDIAFDAGSNDLRTFNRAFRKRYEMTPSDTRAQATHNAA